MSLGQILFSFNGRINRAKWWLGVAIWTAIWIIAVILVVLVVLREIVTIGDMADMSGEAAARLILSWGIWAIVGLIFSLVSLVSGLAIGIKRLHDRNKSGWWIVVFYFGPSIASAIGSGSDNPVVSIVTGLAAFAIFIWMVVELGILAGTPGPNRFGPDPLAQPGAQPAPVT